MTWREIIIARILLVLARMVADDATVRNELKNLSTHIQVEGRKQAEIEALNQSLRPQVGHDG